jgi:hypothetical protein
VAATLSEFEKAIKKDPIGSHRRIAEQLEIPRTTLQHWQKRQDAIDAAPEVVAFFESPAGVQFLHRLVLAAHFVMTQVGPCGIRLVGLFLELSHLSRFVGASYGPHQKVSMAMEQAIVAFGQEEERRLSEGMEPKQITICQDETFHPQPCLVAIEPVSNFILLEQYASNRTAPEWTAAIKQAIAGKPIQVIQSASDEARGILHHVKEDLGVHHSPDLLHVQAEAIQATGVVLASKTRQAQKALQQAIQKVEKHHQEHQAYLQGPRSPGRPPHFERRIQKAKAQEEEARDALEKAQAHQQRAKQAIQGISQTYHPYDLETGRPQSAQEVEAALEGCFGQIEQVAKQAHLPARCLEKISKAKKVVVDMVATVAFFFLMIRAKVEALGLAPEVEKAVYERLIPAVYLSLTSEKAKDAQQRHALQNRSQRLLAPLLARDGPFEKMEKEDRHTIWQVAHQCAHFFQRSSSCVEGRNGQLALRHHSLHRITNRKMKTLTTIHNYFIQRPDGTTPAERFFGTRPRDLFEWVLEQVKLPGRPAQERSHPKPKSYLLQAVA